MIEKQPRRWAYASELVTVGANTQNVRMLTAGERKKFAETSKKIRANELGANDLPFIIASMGCVDPVMTIEEAEDMPPDLLDACVAKIMELTGFKDDEKKDVATPPATS